MKKRVRESNEIRRGIALWKVVLFFVIVVLGVILILDVFSIKEIKEDGLGSYNPLRWVANVFEVSGVIDDVIYDIYGNEVYGDDGVYGAEGDTGVQGDTGPSGDLAFASCTISSDRCGLQVDDCQKCQKCVKDTELINEIYWNTPIAERPKAICVLRNAGENDIPKNDQDNDPSKRCLGPKICDGYGWCVECDEGCLSHFDCIKSFSDVNIGGIDQDHLVGSILLNYDELIKLFEGHLGSAFTIPKCVKTPSGKKECSPTETVPIGEDDFIEWASIIAFKEAGIDLEALKKVIGEAMPSTGSCDSPPSS
ncbi:hypothetical protein HOD75_00535 [archaeon]|jgi:hypothetical protein|nr:hypothetical protein [archaeon]MBT4241362.1 hypothetical protein [archaeon]MBT4418183.1 hypothetical protein [archaeon]